MADIVEIGIHTEALRRDTETLNRTLSSIRSEMDGLYEAFRVLDAMWDGPANQVLNRQFRSDHENMRSICDTVQLLVRCMEGAERKYTNGGNRMRGIVDSMRA